MMASETETSRKADWAELGQSWGSKGRTWVPAVTEIHVLWDADRMNGDSLFASR